MSASSSTTSSQEPRRSCPAILKRRSNNPGQQCQFPSRPDFWPFCGNHRAESKKERKLADERATQLCDTISARVAQSTGPGLEGRGAAGYCSELACVVLVARRAFDTDEAAGLAFDSVDYFLAKQRALDANFMAGLTARDDDVVNICTADTGGDDWPPSSLLKRVERQRSTFFVIVVEEGPHDHGSSEGLIPAHTQLAKHSNAVVIRVRSKQAARRDWLHKPDSDGHGFLLEVAKEFSLGVLPLCGQMGVILQAVHMLWRCHWYCAEGVLEVTDDGGGGDEGGRNDSQARQQPSPAEMALFPCAGTPPNGLDATGFTDSLSIGKYGDPKDSVQWRHYMAGSAEPPRDAEPRGQNGEPCSDSDPAASDAPTSAPMGRSELFPLSCQSTCSDNNSTPPEQEWLGIKLDVKLSLGVGVLHVPDLHEWAKAWMPRLGDAVLGEAERVRIVVPADSSNRQIVRFPIFMPTSGRASTALLNLTNSMPPGCQYLQIVVVKKGELREYQSLWPGHIFYELPDKASKLGIGAARACIKQLAEVCLPDAASSAAQQDPPRCAFVMDDSVLCWKVDCGIPGDSASNVEYMRELAGLPAQQAPDDPGPSMPSVPHRRLLPVCLGAVLLHFQHPNCNLQGIGIIGFNRYNARLTWHRAYSCGHVYSAVLLNLDALSSVQYDASLHVWEDIDFNRRVAGVNDSGRESNGVRYDALQHGLPVIKCYRFLMVKKQMSSGGCCDFTELNAQARREAPPVNGARPRSREADNEQLELSCLWTREEECVEGQLKALCERHIADEERGPWYSTNVPLLRRRLVALELSKRDAIDLGEFDWRLWKALSPCNSTRVTAAVLVPLALKLGMGSTSNDARLPHLAARKTVLEKMPVNELRDQVIQRMVAMDGSSLAECLGAAATLECNTEKWRHNVFDATFFKSEDSLAVILTSSARIVAEVRYFLRWASQDVKLVTNEKTRKVLDGLRKEWLKGVKEQLKGIEGSRFMEKDLEGARSAVNLILGAIKWEVGTSKLKHFQETRSALAAHHTVDTMQIYGECSSPEGSGGPTVIAPASYFSDESKPEVDYAAPGVLRRPQLLAIEAAKKHHASLKLNEHAEGGRSALDKELAALQKLKDAYGRLIHKSYFLPDEAEKKYLEEEVRECRRKLRDSMAATIENDASLLVLPTGLGKTGVMCLLPFILPLRRSRRVLVLAPNLTIAGDIKPVVSEGDQGDEESHNELVVDGLVKEFGHQELSFYRRRGLLPEDMALPSVTSLKQLSKKKDLSPQMLGTDIVVANYHQLSVSRLDKQFDRNFFEVVIVDEAHHAESQAYRMILDHFALAHKVLVTATPYRADGKEIRAKEIHRTSVSACIKNKYVKNIAYCPVPVKSYKLVDANGAVDVNGWEAVQRDGLLPRTQRFAMDNEIVRNSIMQAAMDCLRWLRGLSDYPHQAIVQATSVIDAEDICNKWRQHSANQNPETRLTIDYIAYTRGKAQNNAVMEALRAERKLDVIVHVGMLGEGFDHKRLSVAVIFRAFKSIGPFAQFIGRAVRWDDSELRSQSPRPPSDPFEQIAYVIAHPACGIGEVWRGFCDIDRETGEKPLEGAAKLKWGAAESMDVPLTVVDHVTAPSIFGGDGARVKQYINGWEAGGSATSNYITLFEHQKRKARPQTPDHTPTGTLDAGAIFSGPSPNSGSAPGNREASSSRRPQQQLRNDDSAVRELGPEFAGVS